MTLRRNAPMPAELRHFMRAGQHPARAVPCPHCGVGQRRPCQVPSNKRVLSQPHPQRVSAWALATACCTTCQVTPTVPCHHDGRALADGAVHPARYDEAKEAAA